MKRILPYLLGFILVMALVAITMSAGSNRPRRLNENVTLRQRDKIPYGFYAAYHLLPSLFPRTSITLDKNAPGDWDSISMYGSNQAVVIVAPFFGAYEYELNQLMTFVKNGNHVVIITRNMSREAQEFFNLKRGPFL
ncbi:MAG TPA: DUF4350 domain-containing protein, partial [Flavisolibacter sp.]